MCIYLFLKSWLPQNINKAQSATQNLKTFVKTVAAVLVVNLFYMHYAILTLMLAKNLLCFCGIWHNFKKHLTSIMYMYHTHKNDPLQTMLKLTTLDLFKLGDNSMVFITLEPAFKTRGMFDTAYCRRLFHPIIGSNFNLFTIAPTIVSTI